MFERLAPLVAAPTGKYTDAVYNEKIIRSTLLDLLLYVVYLICVSIISFGTISQSTYIMADMLQRQIVRKNFDINYADATLNKQDEISFADLTAVHELWAFLQSHLLDSIYGEPGNDAADVSPQTMAFAARLSENLLLAPVRVRQKRVRNATCTIHRLFREKFRDCYGVYSPSNEDHGSFGPAAGGAPWQWHADAEGVAYWGALATYSSGGYWLDLRRDRADAEGSLAALQRGAWIDLATRCVLVEFALYNANLNLVCVAKLVAEIPPAGGVKTSAYFTTMRLMGWLTAFDRCVAVAQVVFVLLTIWRTVVEVVKMCRQRREYWRVFWNAVDLLVCVLAYVSLGFMLYRTFRLSAAIAAQTEDEPLNLDGVAFVQVQYNATLAACVFLVWLKLFQHLSFNHTLWQLSQTLTRCAWDLLAFALMFLIVFVAFAQLGYAMFGTENEDFRTFWTTMMTLWRAALGDFDYLAIEKANRVLGPIYFVAYIFLVFFVLLNMFLAIINDAYADVKENVLYEKGVGMRHVRRYLRLRLARVCRWSRGCRRWQQVEDEEPPPELLKTTEAETKSTDALPIERRSATTQTDFIVAAADHPSVTEVASPARLESKQSHMQLQGINLQDIFAYDTSNETNPIVLAPSNASIPLEGVSLHDIFDPIHEPGAAERGDVSQPASFGPVPSSASANRAPIVEESTAVNEDVLRRLELLEQTMDLVMVNLNDILVIVHNLKTLPPPNETTTQASSA